MNLLVVLIIEASIFLIINIILFINYFKRIRLMGYYYQTLHIIKEFGFLIGIIGPVGAGKTTIGSGITHGYQELLLQKINDVMKETKIILNNIDFDDFNNKIDELLNEYEIHVDYNEISNKVMNEFNLFNVPVFQFTGHKMIHEIIKDYIIAYNAAIRNNFVMSKTRFYSHVTGNYNLEYNLENQMILNSKNDYSIYDYLIEVQDESSDDNSKYDWKERLGSGVKEYKSKIRHIHKETNRMIILRQDSSDESKPERDLLQTLIDVQGRKVINPNKQIQRIIISYYKFKKSFKIFFKIKVPYYWDFIKLLLKERKKLKYDSYLESIYNKPNIQRILDKEIKWLDYFFLFNSYIEYEVVINEREVDFLKSNVKKDKVLLYFPVYMCYSFPRFEYDSIQDQLLSNSVFAATEINVFNKPDFFKDKKNKQSKVVDTSNESVVVERVKI